MYRVTAAGHEHRVAEGQHRRDRPGPEARYLADHIPSAKLIELVGADMLLQLHVDALIDEVQGFLTGVRGGAEPTGS